MHLIIRGTCRKAATLAFLYNLNCIQLCLISTKCIPILLFVESICTIGLPGRRSSKRRSFLFSLGFFRAAKHLTCGLLTMFVPLSCSILVDWEEVQLLLQNGHRATIIWGRGSVSWISQGSRSSITRNSSLSSSWGHLAHFHWSTDPAGPCHCTSSL